MLAKRIIPCLDIKDGRVVKGVQFLGLKDAGEPVQVACYYDKEGADELVFLDITASYEKRKTLLSLVSKTAEQIFIPLTVGGGISELSDIRDLLKAGADKVSLNTAAVRNPTLIKEGSEKYGAQCIVVAIDARRKPPKRRGETTWEVFIEGGRTATGLSALKWAQEAVHLGAGEILITSMDRDGTLTGYDLELLKAISAAVSVPVIASGGVGHLKHFYEGLAVGKADAVLAASIFHFGTYTLKETKEYLKGRGIAVRI